MQSRGFTDGFGKILRVAQFVLMGLTVITFLGFIFADNLVSSYYRRTIRSELQQEGLYTSQMRPTPVEGFALSATIPLEGDFYGSALDPEDRTLWLVDAASGLIRFDLQSETVTQRIESEHLSAPQGLSFAQDGAFIVTDLTDPSIVYIDRSGEIRKTLRADNIHGEGQLLRAVESDTTGMLYVLDDTRLLLWPTDQNPRILFTRREQYDLKSFDGHLFTTGAPVNGQTVTKITSIGIDLFQNLNLGRLWALPFWDNPFIGLDVDDKGFITIVDSKGHLVQLDPSGAVLSHLPPIDDAPGQVRSITHDGLGGMIVVHQSGIRRYEMTGLGRTMRHAAMLSQEGQHSEATHALQQVIDQDPHLMIGRRLLAEAYLATDEPLLAAKEYLLVNDRGGFRNAMDDVATSLRKERLWGLLTTLALTTIIVYVLDKAWPALVWRKSDD